MDNKKATLELGTKPVGKLLIQYALPAMVAMTAASLYNIIDRVFIGQVVGPMAISGLAITFPFMNLATAFGAGVGIALTGFLHFILVYVYAHHHYAYRMSTVVLFYAFLQLTLGILVFFCVRSDVQWIRWGVASVLCCASSVVSLRVIKSKTGMWNTLFSKIRNKFSRS